MKARVKPITPSPRFLSAESRLAGREHDERRAEPQIENFFHAQQPVRIRVAHKRERESGKLRALSIEQPVGGKCTTR
jgi:hypothetical protein